MQSFLDPAILFFVFGILAGSLKSNLEIPPPISRFLSLYLLMALGLKGGFSLAQSGLTADVLISLAAALAMATLVPVLGYLTLRRFLNRFDAVAIAATYGSVSAVTFITAVQYLDNHGISFGGHMAAAMALMESPAIVLAVVLANHARRTTTLSNEPVSAVSNAPLGRILHEALTDGAQLLLLGGERAVRLLQPGQQDVDALSQVGHLIAAVQLDPQRRVGRAAHHRHLPAQRIDAREHRHLNAQQDRQE